MDAGRGRAWKTNVAVLQFNDLKLRSGGSQRNSNASLSNRWVEEKCEKHDLQPQRSYYRRCYGVNLRENNRKSSRAEPAGRIEQICDKFVLLPYRSRMPKNNAA
jgi:hypothetical protein